MSAERRYIAVDLGASNGRVAVGTLRSGRLDLEIVHRFATGPVPVRGRLYWDVLGFWREIVYGIGRALSGGEAASVGVDSWAADFALLSASDELLGSVHHYRDSRTAGMMEEAWHTVPRSELYRRTGLQFAPFNTLYQLMAIQRKSPELLDAARTLLFIPDLINFWLCGNRSTEATMASTSQLLDPWTGTWSQGLAGEFGISTAFLPAIVPPGSVLGPLVGDVAGALGGKGELLVVAPGEHDTASAVAAVPATGEVNWAYISSGTWSLVGVETREPLVTEAALDLNLTNEGGVHGTTRLLKNVMGLWLLQECERAWQATSPAGLVESAGSAPPFAAFVNPNDESFFAPGTDMPQRIRSFCSRTGQRPPESQGELARCVLESLALAYAVTFERIEDLLGEELEVIHIVGGGSKNALLCQWTADATGKRVVAGPDEATLLGNMLVQAEALGHLQPEELRSTVRSSVRLSHYQPRERGAWSDALGRFRELLSMAGASQI